MGLHSKLARVYPACIPKPAAKLRKALILLGVVTSNSMVRLVNFFS